MRQPNEGLIPKVDGKNQSFSKSSVTASSSNSSITEFFPTDTSVSKKIISFIASVAALTVSKKDTMTVILSLSNRIDKMTTDNENFLKYSEIRSEIEQKGARLDKVMEPFKYATYKRENSLVNQARFFYREVRCKQLEILESRELKK